LLTGGSDIHPVRYGKNSYLPYCKNIDEKRDELELLIIQLAFENRIPVLGICRGLQALNVAFKGTLIPDIPEFSKSTVPHTGSEDVYHRVNVREKSQLFTMTGVSTEIVNSSHHQAIDTLARGFSAVAHSPDSLIEAIEADPSIHPFCIAVQWHPERMDFSNPLTWKLGVKFLEQLRRDEP
jgi:putative glutamine amidotransferase